MQDDRDLKGECEENEQEEGEGNKSAVIIMGYLCAKISFNNNKNTRLIRAKSCICINKARMCEKFPL